MWFANWNHNHEYAWEQSEKISYSQTFISPSYTMKQATAASPREATAPVAYYTVNVERKPHHCQQPKLTYLQTIAEYPPSDLKLECEEGKQGA